MKRISHPFVLELVASACERKAATVNKELRRGLPSLANISATAPFLGISGTLAGIANAVPSIGSSRSTTAEEIATRLTVALIPMALGIFVAVLALWASRYLDSRATAFQEEMAGESIALVNRLLLDLRRGGNAQPLLFGRRTTRLVVSGVSSSAHADGPRLIFDRTYRNGLLELFWPRLESSLDVDAALERGMWIAFAAAALYLWSYLNRPIPTVIVAGVLIYGGRAIRRGSFFIATALATLLCAFGVWRLASVAGSIPGFLLTTAGVCMIGSARTAWAVSYGKIAWPEWAAKRRTHILFAVWVTAAVIVLFPGPIFGVLFQRNVIGSNDWMEPTLHARDLVVSVKGQWFGALHRERVVLIADPYSSADAVRIVGIPGDRIEVKSGRLIRNGIPVDEPCCQITYSGKLGDFPPSAESPLPDLWRQVQKQRYGNNRREGEPFVVPADTYFVLNDNRNAIFDSRLLGPIKREMIIGRVILAYRAGDDKWWRPKFVR